MTIYEVVWYNTIDEFFCSAGLHSLGYYIHESNAKAVVEKNKHKHAYIITHRIEDSE